MVNPQDNIVDLQDQDQGNQVNKQQILEWGHLTQLWHSWSNRARCLNCSDKRQKTLFQHSTSSATLMTLSGQTAGVTLSHTVTLSMGHGQKMALLSGWHAGLASQPAHLDKSETEFQKQFEVQHNQHNGDHQRKLQNLPEQGRGTTKWCQLLDHPCQKCSKWHRQQSDTILLDATVLGSSSQSVVKCGGPEGLHQGYTGQDVQCWQDSADMKQQQAAGVFCQHG